MDMPQNPAIGVVFKAIGKIIITSDNHAHLLKSGEVIYLQDKISPGNNSAFTILMTDGKIIEQGSNSFAEFSQPQEKVSVDTIQHAFSEGISAFQISTALSKNIPVADLLPTHADHLFYVPWEHLGLVQSGFPTGPLTFEFKHTDNWGFIFNNERPIQEFQNIPVPSIVKADLSVLITDNSLSYIPGNNDLYTITASNAGPDNVNNAIISDNIPAGFIINPLQTTSGFTISNDTISWANITINSGSDQTFLLAGHYLSDTTGNQTQSAAIYSPTVLDPNLSNNSYTDTDTSNPRANLTITNTDNISTITAGNSDAYTITVTNTGPSDAYNVVVNDSLPSQGFNNITSPDSTFNATNDSWSVGTIAAGQSVTLTLDGTVPASATGSSYENDASASASDASSVSASDIDTLTQAANLTITKTDDAINHIAANSSTVNYQIAVTNNGPSDAQSFTVVDTLPNGLDYVTNSADANASFNSSTDQITWTISSINNNQTSDLTYQASTNASELITYNQSYSAGSSASNLTATQVYNAWHNSNVTLYGYDFNASHETNNIINLSNANQTIAYDSGGIGVTETDGLNLQVPDQINHAANNITNDSQALVVDLNTVATTASIEINNLFSNENSGEYGEVTAFSATGQQLNTIVFGAANSTISTAETTGGNGFAALTYLPGSVDEGSFTLTSAMAGGNFSYLTFSALPYGAGVISSNPVTTTDSSDYFIQSINYTGISAINDNLTNTASITNSTTTNTNSNPTAADTIQVENADLAIKITDNAANSPVLPGNDITYTIVVSNNGPFSVTGASIIDNLPASITSDTWTAISSTGATGFSATGSGNIDDTVNLPVNSTITYTVTAFVNPDASATTLSDTATVTPPTSIFDPNLVNNTSNDTDILLQPLSLTKTVTSETGDTIDYNITLTNPNNFSVSNVLLTDNLSGFTVNGQTVYNETVSVPAQSSINISTSYTVNENDISTNGLDTSLAALAVPTDATITGVNPSPGQLSYWGMTINDPSNLGVIPNAQYQDYCIDVKDGEVSGQSYPSLLYSSELTSNQLASLNSAYPELQNLTQTELNEVNYIFNNITVGATDTVNPSNGQYTYSAIQEAVWQITNQPASNETAGLNINSNTSNVAADIVNLANTNGQNFMPVVGQDIGVIVVPNVYEGYQPQITIAAVPLEAAIVNIVTASGGLSSSVAAPVPAHSANQTTLQTADVFNFTDTANNYTLHINGTSLNTGTTGTIGTSIGQTNGTINGNQDLLEIQQHVAHLAS